MDRNMKRERIRELIFEASALMDAEEGWMKDTIILANGAALSLSAQRLADQDEEGPVEKLLGEAFNLADEDELFRYLVNEIEMHAKAGNYNERRKERLGWKPGMTVGTPDVPEDVVAEYEGVIFQCDGCGAGEE